MTDLEIPLGKRTLKYRLFEMLPATMSYGAIALLFILSAVNAVYGVIYLMLVIITMLVKSAVLAIHTIQGHRRLISAQRVNWHARLMDLENPKDSYEDVQNKKRSQGVFGELAHIDNLRTMVANPANYPKPSQIYNAVIVATYNESYEVLEPTIRSVLNTTYNNKQIILVLAYEERGGEATKNTAQRLQKKFGDKFYAFHIVEHPRDLPGEVIGKGGNITHAGFFLKKWLRGEGIESRNVLVTTLDSDNRPHAAYFDYVTYEYIINKNRKNLSYQPISLFLSNIWDAPAPMRVIATGNSFWNIICSMRPHTLRNFASHSQPMEALEEMDFWSTRTIVEDGHQYWRSYFHFGGDYAVVPIYVPIYQDAVLSDTYAKTLKAQFIQLRRWSYGASDVPYIATRIFSHDRNVPFWGGLARFIRLMDDHTTLASVSIMVAFGGWVPLLVNNEAARSIAAHQLPETVSIIQQIALLGLFVTVFLSFKMLPPRPERYKRRRTIWMLTQWALMPVTAIAYTEAAALYSQGRLFMGRYLDKFDVTEKATYKSVDRAKKSSKQYKRQMHKKNNA